MELEVQDSSEQGVTSVPNDQNDSGMPPTATRPPEKKGNNNQQQIARTNNHFSHGRVFWNRNLPFYQRGFKYMERKKDRDLFSFKYGYTGDIARKKRKVVGSRTPLAILNELRPGLVFSLVSSAGPPHNPQFDISVNVDGVDYFGREKNKQGAKQKAAEAALAKLCPTLLFDTSSPPTNQIDFTEDTSIDNSTPPSSGGGGGGGGGVNKLGGKSARLHMLVTNALMGVVNPVMALNELIPAAKYECVSEKANPIQPFVYSITISNELFKGAGSSKKLAKCAAARSVLTQKFGGSSVLLSPEASPHLGTPAFPSPLADQIADVVLSKYGEVMKNQTEYMKRKVISGLVMTRGEEMTDATVVSLATGTKCISGEYMSVSGSVLNDSHAEILNRRAFIRYLYQQLLLHSQKETAEKSIFTSRKEGGFKLKDGIKFHLYINTAPCGDARIFSPHEEVCGGDKHPNRQSRGLLRTKIESGEGTIPVKTTVFQTWDGVIQGERLLTMSCSDKVARWNVVGVQGSLLCHFVEPIYLHSIVVGSLFNSTHMYRAVCGRVETCLSGLPPPFRLNKPLLTSTSSPETRQPGKTPNHSVNWTLGDNEVEVTSAMTGRKLDNGASRLCKQALMGEFRQLLSASISASTGITQATAPQVYIEAKLSAEQYNVAKKCLVEGLVRAELGAWVKKPAEQDQFTFDQSLFN